MGFIDNINKNEKLAPYAKEILACVYSVAEEIELPYERYKFRASIVYEFITNHILENDELPKGIHFVHKSRLKGQYRCTYPGEFGKGGFINFDLTINK